MTNRVRVWVEQTEDVDQFEGPFRETISIVDPQSPTEQDSLLWEWDRVVQYVHFLAKCLEDLGELGRVYVSDCETYRTLYAVISEPPWWDHEMYGEMYGDRDDNGQLMVSDVRHVISEESRYVREFKGQYLSFMTNAFV